jgi:hypothetical protein
MRKTQKAMDSVYDALVASAEVMQFEPFERRGYRTVGLDPYLAWLQKRLDQASCTGARSQHCH